MEGKYKTTWFYSALGTYTKKVGLLGNKEESYYTERHVDLEAYANSLQEKYEELDAQGYEVINVIPIAMGQSESCTQSGGTYVGDVGFSITRGAVVVGKKKQAFS